MIAVRSIKDAWQKADAIFPTDYIKDEIKSERAGYGVYVSTADGVNAWISDLGDRLEVNLDNGKTVSIWVNEAPKFKEWQIADALEVINEAIYQIDDMVDSRLAEETGISRARTLLFGAYDEIKKILDEQYPESELYAKYKI